MQTAKQYFDLLNSEYLAVKRAKEDLFGLTYMTTSDQIDDFAESKKR